MTTRSITPTAMTAPTTPRGGSPSSPRWQGLPECRRPARLQRPHHHPRPDERPAAPSPWRSIDVSGRRWVWAPWGDVNWVRNLRAAGERDHLRAWPDGGRHRDPSSIWTQRLVFFRDVLGPVARDIPFGRTFIRSWTASTSTIRWRPPMAGWFRASSDRCLTTITVPLLSPRGRDSTAPLYTLAARVIPVTVNVTDAVAFGIDDFESVQVPAVEVLHVTLPGPVAPRAADGHAAHHGMAAVVDLDRQRRAPRAGLDGLVASRSPTCSSVGGETVIATVAGALQPVPSPVRYVNESAPE